MEIKVFVKNVLPQLSGVSKAGNNWTKDQFVGETADQYPKTILFSIFNGKVAVPAPGTYVNVSFDAESRSFVDRNGTERWSTDLMAYNITPAEVGQVQQPVQQVQHQPYMHPSQYNTPAVPVAPAAYPSPQPQAAPDDLPF